MMNMYIYELLDNPRKTVQVKRKCFFILFAALFCCALIFQLYCNRELIFDHNIKVFTFQSEFSNFKFPNELPLWPTNKR